MKKFVWIVIPIAALAAIAVLSIPIAVERYAENWLRGQSIADADIDDVDFNPFTGVLRVDSFSVPGPEGQNGEIGFIEVNFDWTKVPARRLFLSSVILSAGEIDIQKHADGSFSVGGLRWPLIDQQEQSTIDASETDGQEWGVGISNVKIDDFEIVYHDEILDSQIAVRRIVIDRLATWEPERTTEFEADIELDGTGIAFRADAMPFAVEPHISSTLTVDRLPLENYSALFQSLDIDTAQGSLSVDLETTVDALRNDTIHIDSKGTVEMAKLKAALPVALVQTDLFSWAGQIKTTVSTASPAAPDVSATNNLKVAGFAIDHRDKPIRLTSFEELVISEATIKSLNHVQVGAVTIRDFELLRAENEDNAIVSIGRTSAKNIAVEDKSFMTIEEIMFDALVVQMEREKSGNIRLVSETIGDFAGSPRGEVQDDNDAQTGVDEATEEVPFRFYAGRIEIGGESGLQFSDFAVDPPNSSKFALNAVSLTDIGNIDPKQSAHVMIDVQQDDAASLIGEGDLRLFDEEMSGDISLALKRFDLTQISSYVPGYHIQRGRLSLDSQARLVGSSLAVDNTVLVQRLSLAGKAAGEKDLLGEGMAMPLDVALDLLRDSEGSIKLELPISGSLTDPQFDTGDIVRTAMQNAMQKAAISYVKNALQPLGTIMFFAKVAGQASRPRFEPVEFEAGNAQLSSQSRAYLDKIAKVLDDRPGLSITFCGVSAPEDRNYYLAQIVPPPDIAATAPSSDSVAEEAPEPPTFEAERLQLAQSRGAAIQEYLIAKHAVDVERLFRCRPTVEVEGDSGPRVEIML